jgi:hypothetical protein
MNSGRFQAAVLSAFSSIRWQISTVLSYWRLVLYHVVGALPSAKNGRKTASAQAAAYSYTLSHLARFHARQRYKAHPVVLTPLLRQRGGKICGKVGTENARMRLNFHHIASY